MEQNLVEKLRNDLEREFRGLHATEAKQEFQKVSTISNDIERLRIRYKLLDRKKLRLTNRVSQIESLIEKNYRLAKKLGPKGERFYYTRQLVEDSRYHSLVLV